MKLHLFFLLIMLPALCSAKLVFEEQQVSVVADPLEDTVAVIFPFTVKGEDEVVVKSLTTPCDCLRVGIGEDDRKIWQSGESGFVSGIIEVGTFRGTQQKHIYVSLGNGETHKLTTIIVIPQLVTFEPESLSWEVGAKPESQTVRLTVDKKYSVQVNDIRNSNSATFDHQIETIVEGKEYLITVQPFSTDAQSLGVLRVLTDSKHQRHESYQAFMTIGKKGRVSKRSL